MFLLLNKKSLFVFLFCAIFFVGYWLNSSPALSFKGYRGAFVVPLIKKDGKTYVLVGRESGGKDKGSYCVPGGSSGWWIFRDSNPLDTASREFCEETLTHVEYDEIRSHIDISKKAMLVDLLGTKKIVTYVVPFKKALINDIITNFCQRRRATSFWQYYHREMDGFALVDIKDLIAACTNNSTDQGVRVKGLVYDDYSGKYTVSAIRVRPILQALVKKHTNTLKF